MKTPKWSDLGGYFVDEDKARELLEQMRWGGNPACPHCGGADPYKITPKPGSSTRKGLWKCKACRKQFTVMVGSVFESSHIKPSKWIQAVYLQTASKKGISAHQLHRMLGVTYTTAWFMAHRLRHAMGKEPFASKLAGTVEVDETYVGARNKRGTRRGRPGPDSHKMPVVALIERGTGRVRAFPMPRVTAENLKEAIVSNVEQSATLMTDEFYSYRPIGRAMAKHEAVNHGRDEYVRGDAHVNTAEGFFSLLKRGINGTYHHIGKGHLAKYCNEFAFRYENRKVSDAERAGLLVQGAEEKRLTYKQPASGI
jgi:transposase-like protein